MILLGTCTYKFYTIDPDHQGLILNTKDSSVLLGSTKYSYLQKCYLSCGIGAFIYLYGSILYLINLESLGSYCCAIGGLLDLMAGIYSLLHDKNISQKVLI